MDCAQTTLLVQIYLLLQFAVRSKSVSVMTCMAHLYYKCIPANIITGVREKVTSDMLILFDLFAEKFRRG